MSTDFGGADARRRRRTQSGEVTEPTERPRLIRARTERAHGRRPRGPRFHRLLRGVYLSGAEEAGLAHHCAAALVIAPPDAVVTGVTALWLHGVEVGDSGPIRLATATKLRIRTVGVRLARLARLPSAAGRIAVPAAAWSSACLDLDLADAVAAADRLLRLGRLSMKELRAAADGMTGPGCRTARRAAGLVRTNVASLRESRLRMLFVLAGLPEPRCNIAVGDSVRRIAEVDLLYDPYRLAVEYEGDHHRTDGWPWSVDIERAESLAAAGYTLIRVTAARMLDPRALAQIVHTHLRDRGYPGPPPTFTPEWCSIFEA